MLLYFQIPFFGDEMYDVANDHQDEYRAVAGYKLEENARFEMPEQLREDFANFPHRVGAEKYPCEAHHVKSENRTYHTFPGRHTGA